jgi:thiosulfate/3-mercaptopyruvate sulfurtransferase
VLLPEFLAATGSPATHVVVDALGPDHHFGQRRFFNRAVHVPGSVLLPSDDFFNADKTWKSPDDIRRLLRYHGIRADHTVISHGGGGGAAAVPWFALHRGPRPRPPPPWPNGWVQPASTLHTRW